MTLATATLSTRGKPVGYHLDTATILPKVVVLDDTQKWNFYTSSLDGVVPRGGIAFTQFLSEAERVIKEKGPFGAYVINLDRKLGTEYGLQNGIDLAERVAQDSELMWFLSKEEQLLGAARKRGFTRLYGWFELNGFPSIDQFVDDIRQELMYGRRAL